MPGWYREKVAVGGHELTSRQDGQARREQGRMLALSLYNAWRVSVPSGVAECQKVLYTSRAGIEKKTRQAVSILLLVKMGRQEGNNVEC